MNKKIEIKTYYYYLLVNLNKSYVLNMFCMFIQVFYKKLYLCRT